MVSNAVELVRPEQQIERVDALDFSQQQIEMIRHSLGMENASALEFDLFINLCRAKRLDPLTKQMYAVPYKGKWQMFASIDGLRVVAQRTGDYGGQTAPAWCGPDLVWREAWLETEPPAAAKVGVYKRGYEHPTWGVATFRSYGTGKQNNWLSMPDVMLAKCAEALALRKAFPDDLSALYVREEFGDLPERQIEPVADGTAPDAPTHPPIVGEVIDAETGEIEIETPASLSAEVKTYRERLGWTAQDVLNDAAAHKVNMREIAGLRSMRDVLRGYVEAEEARGEANAIDAAYEEATQDHD